MNRFLVIVIALQVAILGTLIDTDHQARAAASAANDVDSSISDISSSADDAASNSSDAKDAASDARNAAQGAEASAGGLSDDLRSGALTVSCSH